MEPWKKLLDFIAVKESAGNYNAVFGNAKNTVNLDRWTVDDLIAKKHIHLTKKGQTAAGRYQIINKTLIGLKRDLKLTGKERFTPELQDRMGYELLRQRGYEKFINGKLSLQDFGLNLAKEWASLPVLDGKNRGKSYYDGDGLNAAHVKPEAVEALLSSLLGQTTTPPKPEPTPQGNSVEPEPKGWLLKLLKRIFS